MSLEYRLVFGSNITIETANHLRARICQILERQDFGVLVIMFSSDGGSADQSLALFNFISQLTVPVRMHAIGHVGSAAIPVFLAGSERTGSPLSRFLFHQYDFGFNTRQTLHGLDEAVQRLRSDIKLCRRIIRTHTKTPSDILRALDRGPPSILSPEDAKTFGLIDDIVNLGQRGRNGMEVAVWST